MTRLLSITGFLLGAAVVLWMGSAFVGSNLLALSVTVVIGAVYLVGFTELLGYQRASTSLANALQNQTEKVTALDDWLQQLPVSLRNSVRLRIQGEHIGLPAPILAPYLIGLLVMLGLLGTFAGMVDTLKGAVMALEGTTELEAIRAGLAAPIKGLSMAFGTSVAGIAASAMLGFISTLSRRERLMVSRQLDAKTGSVLQDFSLVYNRDQAFKAMQLQANALPDVAEKLTVLATRLERMSDEVGAQLIARQDELNGSVQTIFTELASSVDQSLQQSLSASAKLSGESIRPVIETMMQGIEQQVQASQQQLTETSRQQLASLNESFVTTSEQVSNAWQTGLSSQQQTSEGLIQQIGSSLQGLTQHFETTTTQLLESFAKASSDWAQQQKHSDQARLDHWAASFDQSNAVLQQTAGELTAANTASASQLLSEISTLLQSSEQLVNARVETETNWLNSHNSRMEQMTTALTAELSALRNDEAARGNAAIASMETLQATVASHLAELGQALEQPMTRLIETASETPRAAAEVFARMRDEIAQNIERDNGLLADRRRIMEDLNTLSASLIQTSNGQRDAIETMVQSSTDMLHTISSNFSEHVESEVVKLSTIVDHFAGSTAEMSSLSEAFGVGVQLFNESNTQLIDNLHSIEQALQSSTERSDEQLSYYIAQAREIIDHSMVSQQEIIEQLRHLSHPQAELPFLAPDSKEAPSHEAPAATSV